MAIIMKFQAKFEFIRQQIEIARRQPTNKYKKSKHMNGAPMVYTVQLIKKSNWVKNSFFGSLNWFDCKYFNKNCTTEFNIIAQIIIYQWRV